MCQKRLKYTSKSRTIHERCNEDAVKRERLSTIEANDMRMFPIPIVSKTTNIIATSSELEISTLFLPDVEVNAPIAAPHGPLDDRPIAFPGDGPQFPCRQLTGPSRSGQHAIRSLPKHTLSIGKHTVILVSYSKGS